MSSKIMSSKDTVTNLLKGAGIDINNENSGLITVNDESFYKKILVNGSLGLGEGYVDKTWESEHVDQFIFKILRGNLEDKYNTQLALNAVKERFKDMMNPQSIFNSKKDISFHYDTGNNLFYNMLDKRMVYTCGYWKNAKNLDEAQEHKLDLICKKIGLKPGMTVLDVGCGWGPFMKYAAEKYGAICTGITLSKEQIKLGEELCEGLPVTFVYKDYREFESEQFDRVVSVGMFEHVGYQNYTTFMNKMSTLLKDDGVFLLHTIGGLKSNPQADPWIKKYIFPNGSIPSIEAIGKSIESTFFMEDWHDFGQDYDKTLMCWHENFIKNWDKIKDEYDEKFKRVWEYYLLSCAGAFRAKDLGLWQIVLTKKKLDKLEYRY
ncbi:MAG: cyclopropane fatty acyl phospholipid synthase [Cetobacterium sp.]|uniref:cyclopropane fatty acyl phospholipid synthase n=1 Tax=Cetobacterium sp. TaxID=2071632 RepID=UPI003F3CEF41